MVQRLLCLMASHGYLPVPGLVVQHEPSTHMKGCQTFSPSTIAKPDVLSYQCPCLKSNPLEESRKTQSTWFDQNQFLNVDLSDQKPMLIDARESCSNAVLLGFGIVEQCTKHNKISKFLKPAEAGMNGANTSLMLDLMNLQLSALNEPEKPLSSDSSLFYPNDKVDIQKPLLYFLQDSALTSKIAVHLDGQITFMGTEVQMKDLLSVVAESYMSKSLRKGEKHSVLVPHFNRVIINEPSHSSTTVKMQSTLTAPLRRPKKVKLNPSPKQNKKVGRERDLYKNSSHAFESLLSLMVDKKRRRKIAIPSLKKSGPELSELLTQISAGIAGTGIAILLSVICNLACGRVLLCASNLFSTGLGLGFFWLSWAINKLRGTIVSISKNVGKLGLKEAEMIHKLDKSIRVIYISTAASLAMAVLSLA